MPGPPAVSLTSAGLGGWVGGEAGTGRGPARTVGLRGPVLCLLRLLGAGAMQDAAGQRGGRVPLRPRGPVSALLDASELCSLVGHRKRPCAGLGGQGRSCSLTQGPGLTSSSHSLAGVGRGGQWGQEPYVATGRSTGQEQRGQASLDAEKGSWESSSPSFQGAIAQRMLTLTLGG